MPNSDTEILPPPPPPTVDLHDLEDLEAMIKALKDEMQSTNIRVRFKMAVYERWCEKLENIWIRSRKLRGDLSV